MSDVSLSEIGQLILGAYAMADAHTLTALEIVKMARGAVDEAQAHTALRELDLAGFAENQPDSADGYRLTRSGIEQTLRLQQALARRTEGQGE